MKKSILAILLALWMAFIFSMSSQNATISSNTSGGTIKAVLSMVPKFTEQSEEVQEIIIEDLQYITRKSAHFLAYMILGILAVCLLLQSDKFQNQWQRSGIIAFGISLLYAMSDEIHQLFVPGRAGQIKDVLIDSSGAAIGILVVILILKLKNKIVSRKVPKVS